MKTVRTLTHADPESSREVKLEGEDLIIMLDSQHQHIFPESHQFSLMDNLDFLIQALGQIKSDIRALDGPQIAPPPSAPCSPLEV